MIFWYRGWYLLYCYNFVSNGGKFIFRELVLKTGAKLTSVEEAIRASQSNIVILAVPKDFYEKQPIHLFEGKVVIDVSNRNSIYAKGESQVFRTIFALHIIIFWSSKGRFQTSMVCLLLCQIVFRNFRLKEQWIPSVCFSDIIPAGKNEIDCTVRDVDRTGILEEFRSKLMEFLEQTAPEFLKNDPTFNTYLLIQDLFLFSGWIFTVRTTPFGSGQSFQCSICLRSGIRWHSGKASEIMSCHLFPQILHVCLYQTESQNLV